MVAMVEGCVNADTVLVLTNLGEPLTEAEFEELAKATNMGEKVQYEDLVKTILAN